MDLELEWHDSQILGLRNIHTWWKGFTLEVQSRHIHPYLYGYSSRSILLVTLLHSRAPSPPCMAITSTSWRKICLVGKKGTRVKLWLLLSLSPVDSSSQLTHHGSRVDVDGLFSLVKIIWKEKVGVGARARAILISPTKLALALLLLGIVGKRKQEKVGWWVLSPRSLPFHSILVEHWKEQSKIKSYKTYLLI